MCVGVGSEDNLQESALSFHHVGPREQLSMVLCLKSLNSLSHLAGSPATSY